MNRCRIAPGLLCLVLTLLVVIPAQAFPPAGYDNISTSARVYIYDPADSTILVEVISLTGDAVIWRGDEFDPGDGRMKVLTYLDTLMLRGYSFNAGDSVWATLDRSRDTAWGFIQQVVAGQDFPAESYFDVFYKITFGAPAPAPSPPGGAVPGTLRYDLGSGIGEAQIEAGVWTAASGISTGVRGPAKQPYSGPANQVDASKARQGGDNIGNATVIGGIPYSDAGTTSGYADDYDEVCPYEGSDSPDVVYSYSPASNESINITLCNGSAYDTKLYVYENGVGNLVACNDDACPGYVSELLCVPLTAGNTYYIIVDGYSGEHGNYVIDITDCPVDCVVDCPANGIPEGEGCTPDEGIDTFNGGCNSTPNVFSPIQVGETVCGTANTFLFQGDPYRDTDWYRLVLTDSCDLTWAVEAEFELLIIVFAANSESCADYTVLGDATAGPCTPVSLTFTVGPGVYWLWAGPSVFTGYPPNGCPYDYVGTVTCAGQIVWVNVDPVHMLDTIYQIPPHGRVYKDPRKTPIIDQATGQIVGWAWHEHEVDPPPGGTDTIPTTGWMDVWQGANPPGPTQPPDETIRVDGQAIISRSDPYINQSENLEVQTEILSMDLTGESQLFGPTILSLPWPAPGLATSLGDEFWPVESFFDVYYRVEFPGYGQTIEPLWPPHMQAEGDVNSFPPEDVNLVDPEPHPVHDVQNPGIIIGWVRPIHWLPPPWQDSTGACCDLSNGSCRITTAADCNPVHETYSGNGTTCTPNLCPVPDPDEDCFESTGQGTVSLHPADSLCTSGIQIALSSILSPATKIELDPPPYHDGQTIQTEMVQMELSGSDPNLGTVIIRERSDRESTGAIENTVTDGLGNFVQGDSYFDLYLEVELPALGLLLNTGQSTLRMEATIYNLPPVSGYFPVPNQPPLRLFDAVTGDHLGWLCHAEHQPDTTIIIPCDEPRGACCDPANDDCRIDFAQNCTGPTEVYQGDNTSCVPNPCEDRCNHDGMRGDANYDFSLDVADLTFLVDYLFRGGDAPTCFEEGDVNGDGSIDVADVTHIVDYLFRGGPPPAPCFPR